MVTRSNRKRGVKRNRRIAFNAAGSFANKNVQKINILIWLVAVWSRTAWRGKIISKTLRLHLKSWQFSFCFLIQKLTKRQREDAEMQIISLSIVQRTNFCVSEYLSNEKLWRDKWKTKGGRKTNWNLKPFKMPSAIIASRKFAFSSVSVEGNLRKHSQKKCAI